jgi:hypothetical protein
LFFAKRAAAEGEADAPEGPLKEAHA